MPLSRRTFMVHVYKADGSAVIEELRTSRRARFDDTSGIEDQIALWLASAKPSTRQLQDQSNGAS
jgi:hypothetical protein